MKGGHYAISRQSYTFSCNYRIIVLVAAKIALGFALCNFVYYSYNYPLIVLKYVITYTNLNVKLTINSLCESMQFFIFMLIVKSKNY